MADITLCRSDKCPVRHLCYRQTATPNEFQQAYWDFYNDEPYGCGEFKRGRW